MSVVAMGKCSEDLLFRFGQFGAQSTTDDRFDKYGQNLLCKYIDLIWINFLVRICNKKFVASTLNAKNY